MPRPRLCQNEMINLACWNVRGLNGLPKQLEVRNFINTNKLCLVGLIETRIRVNNFNAATLSVFCNWKVLNNYNCHVNVRL